jgi:nitrite reductase/ring-hydroxylating ferredoxin subunit
MNQWLDRWFPVARGEEIVPRHVVQAQLLGQEIALWRDDAGLVNAWENRCPHRGVRLSIGLNTGTELRCQYHGWRYATGSGQCNFIPAHPDQKPPNVIKANSYGCVERYDYVWVNLAGAHSAPPSLDLNDWTTLRSIFVEAPVALVIEQLIALYKPELTSAQFAAIDEFTLGAHEVATVFLQPLNERQTLIHTILPYRVAAADRIATLRAYNAQLAELRDTIEKIVVS